MTDTTVPRLRRIALAYSGGLDTSIIIPWLKEHYGAEIVAVIADVGQSDDCAQVRAKALKTGAAKVVVADVVEEFITGYIWPTLKAGAVYDHKYLLGTSFARPIIAKKQVEAALATGCDALAHGCTGKGNDQVRFELTYKALAPHLAVIAPWREWEIRSREDAIAYARAHRVPIEQTVAKIYSRDHNIWHISHEGGALEDPGLEAPADVWMLTRALEDTPDQPEYVAIGFEAGVPVSVDGKRLAPVALLRRLNELGGRHGIGRIDLVENRFVGMKSRGAYETPGGTLLLAALRELEALTLDRDTAFQKQHLALEYARLVYNGLWFTPQREALDAWVNKAQERTTGEVRLKLYKGHALVAGRKSPYSLFSTALASFTMNELYDQRDAAGFINCVGLPIKTRALLQGAGRQSRGKRRKASRA
ncbi:MAG TPA: argininosuccinate synthase [Terriglobales bacterium]|nr:argininosuccinate synthase [Terriglobales bacterium]